jgi:cysteine desulfurase
MAKVMAEDFGNPSSTHSFGRNAKSVLELSRKSIAKRLNASAQEIIFTSCGTEANNWILRSAVADLKVKRIITSKMSITLFYIRFRRCKRIWYSGRLCCRQAKWR